MMATAMKSTLSFEWLFGGWLGGHSAAPYVLSAVLVTLLGIALWSYHRTLRPLTGHQRWILFSLRAALAVALFLCLANPARVERTTLEDAIKRPLAILVDRSDSMTATDNRHRSRLDNAAKIWPRIREAANANFSEVRFHAFGHNLLAANDFASAIRAPVRGEESFLFTSLQSLIDAAPPGGYEAVLTLTDGLDTSMASPDEIMSRAIAADTALYFAPGENRLRPQEQFRIREIHAPARVLRLTHFDYEAVIEGYSATAREIPVELWSGDRQLASETLQITPGVNLISWKKSIKSDEPGILPLQLRFNQEAARSEIRVIGKTDLDILYYQGALDWGFRFLSNVLHRDPSFRLTALFNPATAIRLMTVSNNASVRELPSTSAELAQYRIVVLANIFADQLTLAQQNALADYVKNGGGVLFLVPDNDAAEAFAGTKIEEMLPVAFGGGSERSARDRVAERFQEMMRTRYKSANGLQEAIYAEDAERRNPKVKLVPFSFPQESELASLFQLTDSNGVAHQIEPKFASYAAVSRSKPGAEVLAVHPVDRDPSTGKPRILLASQSFGRGRSSVLTTDPLWRWKLSLASDSRETEVFWQQLLHWLAGAQINGLHFTGNPPQTGVKQPTRLMVAGASGDFIHVIAAGPDGSRTTLSARPEGDRWSLMWTPPTAGEWKITARDRFDEAAIYLQVTPAEAVARETMNLPPAVGLMQRLAAATGGEILRNDPPAAWKSRGHTLDGQVLSERRDLLWNTWWVLGPCLGIFATELILRRRWKLL